MESHIEKLVFASRWLQAPLYLGLFATLLALAARFFLELVHLFTHIAIDTEALLVLVVVHLTFVASALGLALLDRMTGYRPTPVERAAAMAGDS